MEDSNPNGRILISSLREGFATEKCCLICLKVVAPHQRKQHKQTLAHRFLVCCLKREIYPFPCIHCEMRFSTKGDLIHHSLGHNGNLASDNVLFSPVCCYLCRLPFISEEELDRHSTLSVEHHCRRQMVLEMALRESIVSELSDINNLSLASNESIQNSRSDISVVLGNKKTNLLCSHTNAQVKILDSQTSCLICCNTVDETFNSDQNNTEVPFQSKTKSPEIFITVDDTVKIQDSSTFTFVQEEIEEGTSLVSKNSKTIRCNPVDGSSSLEMAPRELLVSESSDMIYLVPQATLKECTKTSMSANSLSADCEYPIIRGITFDSDHLNSVVPFQCENTASKLVVDSTVKLEDSYSAFHQEKFEKVKTVFVTENNKSKSYNPEAPSKALVSKFLDSNDASQDVLKESTPKNPKKCSPVVQEDVKTNLPSTATDATVKTLDSQIYCSVCSIFVSSKKNMPQHKRGKNHRENCEALQSKNSKSNCYNSVDKMLGSNQNKSKVSLDMKMENTPTPVEILPTADTVKIGDSTFACLQDEFEEVETSVGKDLNDFQVECETCGGVFPTYNNNLDFSYELHVQNDPQHALAVSIPLERDAKQMGEYIRTSTAPKKVKKRTRAKTRKVVSSTISHAVGDGTMPNSKSNALQPIKPLVTQERKSIIQGVGASPKVELEKVVPCDQTSKQANLDYFCKICEKHMTTGNKSIHEKGKLHKNNAKLASLDYFCKICEKHMTTGNKSIHEKGKVHKKNSSLNFFCSVCSQNMTQGEKESHLVSSQHQRANALLTNYFCCNCNKNMIQSSKSDHLASKEHKENTLVTFFCTVCSERMTPRDKESHLLSPRHKEFASLFFFCDTCNIVMTCLEKENHLVTSEHKENGSLDFFCDVCSKTLKQGCKNSHLRSRQHITKMLSKNFRFTIKI